MIIVDKIKIDNRWVADLPSDYEYQSVIYNQELDKYEVYPTKEQAEKDTITNVQGKSELVKRDLYAKVAGMVSQAPDPLLAVFWENATYWNKNTPAVQMIAQQLGLDLDEFFTEAKKIQL